jgi:hypothetical protein
VSCGEWATHWLKVLDSAKPKNQVYLDFLVAWNRKMANRIIHYMPSTHLCFSEIRPMCEKPEKERLYLIAVALNTGCAILYCSLDSSSCDKLSAIDHHDVVSIKTHWRKSELPETVQWLLGNSSFQ